MSAHGRMVAAMDIVTRFITTTSWPDLPPTIQMKSVSCLPDVDDVSGFVRAVPPARGTIE